MKFVLSVIAVLLFSFAAVAQTTPPPSAFSTTTFSFGLSPIQLPGSGQGTLAGAETDVLFNLSTNNVFGQTTLVGQSTFIGGRYERIVPAVAKYLQNHTALTGENFEAGVTTSLGIVRGDRNHWGGRAGIFLKYAPNGSQNFNIGFELQANYLPGYSGVNSPHWVPSVAVGPNFRF